MANTRQSKKRAKQANVRRLKNMRRKSAMKTAVKKVMDAIEQKDGQNALLLLRNAEAQLARAKGKRVIHANTAARKISRLAKRVAQVNRAEATAA